MDRFQSTVTVTVIVIQVSEIQWLRNTCYTWGVKCVANQETCDNCKFGQGFVSIDWIAGGEVREKGILLCVLDFIPFPWVCLSFFN